MPLPTTPNSITRRHLPAAILAAVLLILHFITVTRAERPKAETQASNKPPVRVTISKETTWITAPLREDGYPDYIRYLNEKLSEGVTPENNAAVLYLRAFGPREMPEDRRQRFFEMLGIEPLPEDHDYLIDWFDFVRKVPESELPPPERKDETARESLMAQLWTASERPWKASEFVHVAAYLDQNKRPIRLIEEGSRRNRVYVPNIAKNSIIESYLPQIEWYRQASETLAARAMRNLDKRDHVAAWHDSLTLHRIAGQLRGSIVIDVLVGISVDSKAWQVDTVLLRDSKLDPGHARQILNELAQLPSHDHASLQSAKWERLAALDMVCLAARSSSNALAAVIDPPNFDFDRLFDDRPLPMPLRPSLLTKLAALHREAVVSAIHARCDWDVPLRELNAAFERLEQSLSARDRATRIKLLADLIADAKRAEERGRGLNWYAAYFEPRNELSRRVAGLFVGMHILPMKNSTVAGDRFTTQRRLVQVGAALAAYRAERGDYPQKLADLAPIYLKAIPVDSYQQSFVYRRTSDGDTKDYVLYSLGENGKDDGGVNCRDDECSLDISFHPNWSHFPLAP
jgi:hypothetical protein